ncbi:WxL domain-containing protein [Carnobacterium maltaromaticum]|uniref:WxL domain-containing protein n=1 Tax=Carnobacterium maltaromaticum TaxID=2751 RepID=UPI0018CF7CC9|nr:WxL domain-containing protein [Carnobacterium maltaromaticum]
MKKKQFVGFLFKNLVIGLISLTALAGLSIGTVAEAEDNTTAEITVKAGSLKIRSKDDISFDSLVIDGKDHNDYEEKGTSKITIEDFRGSTSTGWNLGVKIDTGFSKEKTGGDNGISLKLNPVINSNKEAATASENTVTLNGENITVASVKDDKIKDSDFDTEIYLGAKLDIPMKTKANTYSAILIWNVTEGPTE